MFPPPYNHVFREEWGRLYHPAFHCSNLKEYSFSISPHKTYLTVVDWEINYHIPICNLQVQWNKNTLPDEIKKYIDNFLKILKMEAFL